MIGVKIKSIEYSLPKKVEYLADLKKDNPEEIIYVHDTPLLDVGFVSLNSFTHSP